MHLLSGNNFIPVLNIVSTIQLQTCLTDVTSNQPSLRLKNFFIHMNNLILILFIFCFLSVVLPPPFPSFSPTSVSGTNQNHCDISPTSVSGINQKQCDIRFFQKITFLVDFQISTNFLLTSFVVLLILMKMSQTILCSTTYVPFDANLNLLKKNKHLSQSFQFIYFTVGFVLNEINFLDLLIILLHCDLICLPTKWFPYTVLFLIQLLITHYSDTVRFFMKSVLTVYIGFQSYYILYANICQ